MNGPPNQYLKGFPMHSERAPPNTSVERTFFHSRCAALKNAAHLCVRHQETSVLDNGHEAVFPPKTNRTLWRYTDLTKLLSLLESRQLFFTRSDQFEDPYEGALSGASVALLRREAEQAGMTEPVEMMIQHSARFRESMFISCWNASDHE